MSSLPPRPSTGVSQAAQLHEPVRLLASDAALSPALRNLLLSPPPVKPLGAHVAARVRSAVLEAPVAAAAKTAASINPSQPLAYAKLGAVAATAALFGAAVMTLVSGYVNSPSSQFGSASDRSGVVVVSANQSRTSHRESGYGAGLEASRAVALGGAGRPELDRGSTEPAAKTQADDNNTPDGAGLGRESNDVDAQLDQKLGAPSSPAAGRGGDRGATLAQNEAASLPAHGSAAAGANTQVLSVDDLAAADDHVLFQAAAGRSAAGEARVLVRPAFRRIASGTSDGSLHRASREQAALKYRGHQAPPRAMSSLEEETLLLEDARSKLGRDPERALVLALEHQSQFRRGQLLEQRRMIHLEALLRLGRDKEALELAKSIGNSLYQASARALLTKYGI